MIFERTKFNSRSQRERGRIHHSSLVDSCDYGSMKEEMLWDRTVIGIHDRALSEKLQMDSKLTLEQAKKSARQKEAVKDQHKQPGN